MTLVDAADIVIEWSRQRVLWIPRLARRGITHATDTTPGSGRHRAGVHHLGPCSGELLQHVWLLGVTLESNTDSGLPRLNRLTERIRSVHEAGRAVAVHCATSEALVLNGRWSLMRVGPAGVRGSDKHPDTPITRYQTK